MAEGGRSERESLGSFSGGHRKYGSTSQVKQTNETYMKHIVKPGETLQGIALKYGKTVSNSCQYCTSEKMSCLSLRSDQVTADQK